MRCSAYRVALALAVGGCSSSTGSSSGPPAAIAAITKISGDGQSGEPGHALVVPLVAKVVDANGAAIRGAAVTWSADAGTTVTPGTVTTDSNGLASAIATLRLAVGTATITAAAGSVSTLFAATANVPAAPIFTGSISASAPVNGGKGGFSVTVANDVGPVAGVPVHWNLSAHATATMQAPITLTGATGIAIDTMITKGAERDTLTITVGGAQAGLQFVVAYVSPLSIAIQSPQGTVACAGARKTVRGTVTDAVGQAVPHVGVHWAASAPGEQVTFDATTTDGTGNTTDTLVTVAANVSHPLTAVAIADGAVSGQFTASSGGPCPQSLAITTPAGPFAALGHPIVVQAHVSSQAGNIAGATVTWSILSGSGAPTLPTSTTDGSGNAQTTFVGSTLGPRVIRADIPSAGQQLTVTTVASAPTLVSTITAPSSASFAHDSYVRDGIAFLCFWNKGVAIYDVGNGVRGGSPANPVQVSSLITSDNGVPGGPAVHNAWWFHNPVSGENRYLFIGQEGPGLVGSTSSGDIHIVDVSDLSHPREVGFVRVPGAGTHNFWMDEAHQTLYAAYYTGGVVKIDVSGTLAGDMSNRVVAQQKLAGSPNVSVWSVQLSGSTLYVDDMLTGLWALDPATLAVRAGGNNQPADVFLASDFWVAGNVAYTGSYGAQNPEVAIWSLGGNGAPTLSGVLLVPNISIVSDVAVSPNGKFLVVTTEHGNCGLYVYSLVDPLHPTLLGQYFVAEGLHTGETKEINGRTYVFGARDPSAQQFMIFDITDMAP